MPTDGSFELYLAARRMALRGCIDADFAAASIGRAEARLQAYFAMAPEAAAIKARRAFLHTSDAAFHDQLLACGRIDILRAAVERTAAADAAITPARGTLAVSLHYGPSTAILPLCLAMAKSRGAIPDLAVIENSRRNPSVMITPDRFADLAACGFPITDLDIANLGELGAMRRALAILRHGGTVLIFADGQLPPPGGKRALTCRLGRGTVAFAQGAQWLAETADVPLLPLLLLPQADGHRVAALPPQPPTQASRALQELIDAAMAADPAPWWRWCSSADHF
jgi:predicted LPLAT superfamily acyltransferase